MLLAARAETGGRRNRLIEGPAAECAASYAGSRLFLGHLAVALSYIHGGAARLLSQCLRSSESPLSGVSEGFSRANLRVGTK